MNYRSRRKIGVITPDPSCVENEFHWEEPGSEAIFTTKLPFEFEFHKVAPNDVALVTAVMPFPTATPEALIKLSDYALECAITLAREDPDLILFCCTAGSFIEGFGYDKEIIKRIEDRVGIPTTTTSTAVIDALHALKVQKLNVVTPYLDVITEQERLFLVDSGFKVTSIKGLDLSVPSEVAKVTSETMHKLLKEIFTEDAEAVFISCTGLAVIDLIETLERELKRPALTSNQVNIWSALRKIGIKDKIEGYGKLLMMS